MASVALATMVAAGLLLFASQPSIGQQQGAANVPQSASCQGPPLETYVNSLSEDGQYEFTTVYHANGTFDLESSHGENFSWSSHNPLHIFLNGRAENHGRWSLKGCTFCFVLDRGIRTGEKVCKLGRLIGRVSIDGTPLPDRQQKN